MFKSSKKQYSIQDCALYKVASKKLLAKLLFVSPRTLSEICSSGVIYSSWQEPKKNGGFRDIDAPSPLLKSIQKRIKELLDNIEKPKYLFCPVKGKSYVHNAALHVQSKSIAIIDVKNYFPSTSSKRVYWFFRKILKCSEDVAGILAKITTLNGSLPQGSPASPILSFYSHMDMWGEIFHLVDSSNCQFSLYIDDITISGNPIPKGLIWEVKKLLKKRTLDYHKEKSSIKGRCEVTGVIVNNGRLLWPNKKHKQLHLLRKAFLNERNPVERKSLQTRIRSRISQSHQIFHHPL